MTSMRCALALSLLAACGGDEPAAAPPQQPPAIQTPATTSSAPVAQPFEIDTAAPVEVQEGATITLSGSVPGAQPDEKLAFEWKQLSGPTAKLTTPYAATTSSIAPEGIADYELRFELAVTRGTQVARQAVSVLVRADDDPPTAEIYAPRPAECGERVVLIGQGRTLEPQQLRFQWRQFGDGPKVQIDDGGGSQASFVAPEFSGHYTVWFELSVSDGVNPPAVARVQVTIECDGRATALPAGRTRKLASDPGVASPLPRGAWDVTGALTLTQTAPEQGAIATLRFEYGPQDAAAVEFTKNGQRAGLRMLGLTRDSADGPWREPQSSGERDLGEWPADQALGFEFAWDGHELAIHWGPPGARKDWPKLPFPVSFPLASRPRSVVVEARGGTASVEQFLLTGR
jgi:hypothetical protein